MVYGESVVDALVRVSKIRKISAMITVDHGTEFTSLALDEWVPVHRVSLRYKRKGKPTDHGLCESFNSILRDECLNVHKSKTIERFRDMTTMKNNRTVH